MNILRILSVVVLLAAMSSSCQSMEQPNIVLPEPLQEEFKLDANIFDKDYRGGAASKDNQDSKDNQEKSEAFIKDIYTNINKCELIYQKMLRYTGIAFNKMRQNPIITAMTGMTGGVAALGVTAYRYGLHSFLPVLFSSNKLADSGASMLTASVVEPAVKTVASDRSPLGEWLTNKWSTYTKLGNRIPDQLDPAWWVVKAVEFSQPSATSSSVVPSAPVVDNSASLGSVSSDAVLTSSGGRNWKPWLYGAGAVTAIAGISLLVWRNKILKTPAGRLAIEAKKLRRFMDLYSYMRRLGTWKNIGEKYKQPGVSTPKKYFEKFYYDLGAYQSILQTISKNINEIPFVFNANESKRPEKVLSESIRENIAALQSFIQSKEEKLKNAFQYKKQDENYSKYHTDNLNSYVVGSYTFKVHRLKSLEEYLSNLWNQPPHENVKTKKNN